MTADSEENEWKDWRPIFHRLIDEGIVAGMSAADIKIYLVLNRYANYKTNDCYPSVKKIREQSGVSKNKIANAVRRLERMGLIETRRAGARFWFKKIYVVKFITPEKVLSPTPGHRYKSKDTARGTNGCFGGAPAIKDESSSRETSCIIPEFREQSKEEAASSENTESCIIPGLRDEVSPKTRNIKRDNINKNEREILKAGSASACLGSQASPAFNLENYKGRTIETSFELKFLINKYSRDKVIKFIKAGSMKLAAELSLNGPADK